MEQVFNHMDKTYFIIRNFFRREHYIHRIIDMGNDLNLIKKIHTNIIHCYNYISHIKKQKVFLTFNVNSILSFYEKAIILITNIFKIIMSKNYEFQEYIFKKSSKIFLELKDCLIKID